LDSFQNGHGKYWLDLREDRQERCPLHPRSVGGSRRWDPLGQAGCWEQMLKSCGPGGDVLSALALDHCVIPISHLWEGASRLFLNTWTFFPTSRPCWRMLALGGHMLSPFTLCSLAGDLSWRGAWEPVTSSSCPCLDSFLLQLLAMPRWSIISATSECSLQRRWSPRAHWKVPEERG
jgi:hypothetical protein